jgi:hypothetical protein
MSYRHWRRHLPYGCSSNHTSYSCYSSNRHCQVVGLLHFCGVLPGRMGANLAPLNAANRIRLHVLEGISQTGLNVRTELR